MFMDNLESRLGLKYVHLVSLLKSEAVAKCVGPVLMYGKGIFEARQNKETIMLKSALERDAENRPYERSIRAFGEILLANPDLLSRLDETHV